MYKEDAANGNSVSRDVAREKTFPANMRINKCIHYKIDVIIFSKDNCVI